MALIRSNVVTLDGVRTHYLEGGTGSHLILLHSGEFGASAALTWEFNLQALSEHFHVVAPDFVGFGESAKIFNFEGMFDTRVRQIAQLIAHLKIDRAHFIGNSMGGTMLAAVASRNPAPWPTERIVLVSGGGLVPENDARATLTSYDGTFEHMRKIVKVLVQHPVLREDQVYIERRHQSSIAPGAWECIAAARFRPPGVVPSTVAPKPEGYENVSQPVLIIAGEKDPLREPNYADDIQRRIAGADLVVFKGAGHCPQIDRPEAFNGTVIDYLLSPIVSGQSRREI